MILLIGTILTIFIAKLEAYFDGKNIPIKTIEHKKSFIFRSLGLIPMLIYLVVVLDFSSFHNVVSSLLIIICCCVYLGGIYWVEFESTLYIKLNIPWNYLSKNMIDKAIGNKWLKVVFKFLSISIPLTIINLLL